jgi:hypothetical protein
MLGLKKKKPSEIPVEKLKAPSPREMRLGFQQQLDYWDDRMRHGDPLFDQEMVDARDYAIEGLALMDKFEEIGYDTGKGEIVSDLVPFKTADVFWHLDGGNKVYYKVVVDGGGSTATNATVGPDVETDLERLIRNEDWLGKSMDENTVFTFKKDR